MDKKNKVMIFTGSLITAVSLLVSVISAFDTPEIPDPAQLDKRTKVAYMATKEFAGLPEKEKEKYVKKAGRLRGAYRQLSGSERQAVFKHTRKIRLKQMKERADGFFRMNKEEQNKFLDEMIARREKWRKAREAARTKRGTAGNSNSSGRRGNRNAWRQYFLEGVDSTTRARFMEIRRRMRERMKQTGKK